MAGSLTRERLLLFPWVADICAAVCCVACAAGSKADVLMDGCCGSISFILRSETLFCSRSLVLVNQYTYATASIRGAVHLLQRLTVLSSRAQVYFLRIQITRP